MSWKVMIFPERLSAVNGRETMDDDDPSRLAIWRLWGRAKVEPLLTQPASLAATCAPPVLLNFFGGRLDLDLHANTPTTLIHDAHLDLSPTTTRSLYSPSHDFILRSRLPIDVFLVHPPPFTLSNGRSTIPKRETPHNLLSCHISTRPQTNFWY